MSLTTNRSILVRQSVLGEISSPTVRQPYRVGADAVARALPGTGGITYNVRVGDPALGWAGDHVEPSVSTKNRDADANGAYTLLACVGNLAVVVSGDAKGAAGRVTGKHGGIEHVLVDFAPEVMEKLVIGDRVQVQAFGVGLALPDYPGVRAMSLDPDLLLAMDPKPTRDGRLQVAVTAVVPAHLMGSGIGSPTAERGDYDITTQDAEAVAALGLGGLRLGDVVAIADRSSQYGRSYRHGALEIGVVVHCDSYLSGHGPGVTTLLTCQDGTMVPVLDPEANIARYLSLRS